MNGAQTLTAIILCTLAATGIATLLAYPLMGVGQAWGALRRVAHATMVRWQGRHLTDGYLVTRVLHMGREGRLRRLPSHRVAPGTSADYAERYAPRVAEWIAQDRTTVLTIVLQEDRRAARERTQRPDTAEVHRILDAWRRENPDALHRRIHHLEQELAKDTPHTPDTPPGD